MIQDGGIEWDFSWKGEKRGRAHLLVYCTVQELIWCQKSLILCLNGVTRPHFFLFPSLRLISSVLVPFTFMIQKLRDKHALQFISSKKEKICFLNNSLKMHRIFCFFSHALPDLSHLSPKLITVSMGVGMLIDFI